MGGGGGCKTKKKKPSLVMRKRKRLGGGGGEPEGKTKQDTQGKSRGRPHPTGGKTLGTKKGVCREGNKKGPQFFKVR